MPPTDTFNAFKRRREKERARQEDLARIAAGIETPTQVRDRNFLFSALDPKRVRVIGRRRVRLDE